MHVCDSIVQNRKSAWPQRKPAREKLTRITAGCRLRDVTHGNLSTSGVAAVSATPSTNGLAAMSAEPSTDDIFDADMAVDDSTREWLQRAQHPGEEPKSRSRSPSVDWSVSLVSWSLAEEQRAAAPCCFLVTRRHPWRGDYARLLRVSSTSLSTSDPKDSTSATNIWLASELIGVEVDGGLALRAVLPPLCGVGPRRTVDFRMRCPSDKRLLLEACARAGLYTWRRAMI